MLTAIKNWYVLTFPIKFDHFWSFWIDFKLFNLIRTRINQIFHNDMDTDDKLGSKKIIPIWFQTNFRPNSFQLCIRHIFDVYTFNVVSNIHLKNTQVKNFAAIILVTYPCKNFLQNKETKIETNNLCKQSQSSMINLISR